MAVRPPRRRHGGRPRRRRRGWPAGVAAIAVIAALLATAGRAIDPDHPATASSVGGSSAGAAGRSGHATVAAQSSALPGMPPVGNAKDIYAADNPSGLSPAVRGDRPLIYVPNSGGDTVTEIDPRTYKVVRTFVSGRNPQHVVPSWDLKTLWVTNDLSNSLTPINPKTGLPGPNAPVTDPYNMYFTPDGRHAIVVAEAHQQLDFRDPHTMALTHALSVPCRGVDHIDFSADGRYLLATCEFSGTLVKVATAAERVVATLQLPSVGGMTGMPQDVKLSPDGKVFYVADMVANGVYEVDGASMRVIGFIPTGLGAHGLYVSRNDKALYVSNRMEGSISVISLATRKVITKWRIPGGGSPDMGNVSVNGKVLWLSGRYNSVVYAIDTSNGKLLAEIPVGTAPHGLSVWPQPGRYSLGHTGILR
ncbi:MAG TPA: YncE family protein [Acidimicrobiales bacterium]|nr:YncE family protein [Acidimicrobiales bacterium]